VRRRVAQRRRALATGVGGAAALAVVLAVAVPLALARGDGRPILAGTPSAGPEATFPPTPPAIPPPTGEPPDEPGPGAGWRIESAGGLEIDVPSGWAVNDFGCNMTGASTVVRGGGRGELCLTPEPTTKEVAILERTVNPPFPPDLSSRPVTIGGVGGQRAEGRLSDGRYAGWIVLPSREQMLEVRTRAAATTKRILDSLRVVTVDHLGCPVRRPKMVPRTVPGTGLLPSDMESIVLCAYAGEGFTNGLLETSARPNEEDTRQLADAINTATPGRNANAPAGQCLVLAPAEPTVVLRVRATGGATTWVWVTYEGCTDRGLDNGVRQAQLTRSLIVAFLRALQVSGGFGGDLPP